MLLFTKKTEILKSQQKEARAKCLDHVYNVLIKAQQQNNGRIPHKIVQNIFLESNPTFLWTTCHEI